MPHMLLPCCVASAHPKQVLVVCISSNDSYRILMKAKAYKDDVQYQISTDDNRRVETSVNGLSSDC
jgi:hypothetical protein